MTFQSPFLAANSHVPMNESAIALPSRDRAGVHRYGGFLHSGECVSPVKPSRRRTGYIPPPSLAVVSPTNTAVAASFMDMPKVEDVVASSMAARLALARAAVAQQRHAALLSLHTQQQQQQHRHHHQQEARTRVVSPVKPIRRLGLQVPPLSPPGISGLDLLHSAAKQASSGGSGPSSSATRLTPTSPHPSSSNSTSSMSVPNLVDASSKQGPPGGKNTDPARQQMDDHKTNGRLVYIDTVQPNDILCGRGGRSNHHQGNKRYRLVIANMKRMYQNCPAKTLKTDLSRAIVEHCCSYGARFVKKCEKTGRYYVLTKAEARKKTSQALRETKALKWTL